MQDRPGQNDEMGGQQWADPGRHEAQNQQSNLAGKGQPNGGRGQSMQELLAAREANNQNELAAKLKFVKRAPEGQEGHGPNEQASDFFSDKSSGDEMPSTIGESSQGQQYPVVQATGTQSPNLQQVVPSASAALPHAGYSQHQVPTQPVLIPQVEISPTPYQAASSFSPQNSVHQPPLGFTSPPVQNSRSLLASGHAARLPQSPPQLALGFEPKAGRDSKEKIRAALMKHLNQIKDEQLLGITLSLCAQNKIRPSSFQHDKRLDLTERLARGALSTDEAIQHLESLLGEASSAHLNPDLWFAWFSEDSKATMWLWQVIFHNLHPNSLAAPASINFTPFRGFVFDVRQNNPLPNSSKQRLDEILSLLNRVDSSRDMSGQPIKTVGLNELRSLWESGWQSLVKSKKWEKSGPKQAARWAFDWLLDTEAEKFLIPGHYGAAYSVRDLGLHLNPVNDDEALLAFYALVWQLYARNPEATAALVEKCAATVNQRVLRHYDAEAKYVPKKAKASLKVAKGSIRKNSSSANQDSLKVEEHFVPADGMPLQDPPSMIFTIYAESEFVLVPGRSNAQLDAFLEEEQSEAGFFMRAQLNEETGISLVQAVFALAIEKLGGKFVTAMAYDPSGEMSPQHGLFVYGRAGEHTYFIAKELDAEILLWCRRGVEPIFINAQNN